MMSLQLHSSGVEICAFESIFIIFLHILNTYRKKMVVPGKFPVWKLLFSNSNRWAVHHNSANVAQ